MLTPKRYWRIARSVADLDAPPPEMLPLPDSLVDQKVHPASGDGLLLADYDASEQTGLVRYLGLVRETHGRKVLTDWRPTQTQIWVDSPSGRGNWASKPGFCFADTKVAGYGLHALFADTFDDMQARETLQAEVSRAKRRSTLPKERTEPMEVVGEATAAARGGWVYVLNSAFGQKIGRPRSMPDRMKTFAVRLPFLYTIPLCAWFDDHIDAESRYHRLFENKRLNGEWFLLDEDDVDLVRRRVFEL